MKLTVVGGGSTYTPELVDGFARLRDILPLTELSLVDPNRERLELVAGVSQRMFDHADYGVKVTLTSDLREGAADADAVLFQLRVGGQEARHKDEIFPHSCGIIGQETTGPGGFAKALRTVPVMLDVAKTVREAAKKDAWLIDFTNPTGIVTRALLQHGHRAVGLCNVAIGFQRRFAEMLEVPWHDVQLDHVGLNHLTWERKVLVRRGDEMIDVLPELIDTRLDELAAQVQMPGSLVKLLGNVPSYYLRYFYLHDTVFNEQQESDTRAHAVAAVEKELLELYANPSVNTKPEQLTQRGGAFYSEAAVDLIASLYSDRGDVQVVNLRNDGTLPFLPDDHVIEVPAVVNAAGVTAIPVEPLAPVERGLVAHVASYERLALEAAELGGYDRVVKALLANPLLGTYEKSEKLAADLIAANRDYLRWA